MRSIYQKSLFLALGLMFAHVPAEAGTFYCKADPKAYLAVDGHGQVFTGVHNGTGYVITAICSMSANDGGTTPQACTAWYSMLLSLRATGGTALPHFNTSEPSNSTAQGCESLQGWEHHTAYFMPAQ